MKNSREVAYQITKLQLQADNPTDGLLKAILDVAPDYPKEYLVPWFNNAHRWTLGTPDSGAGPGTDYMLGYLDAAKELDYDISLVIQATKNWRPNKKRENAINVWLTKNT
jgi:hypothetical protein